MPIYEYECTKCKNVFSVLQSLYPEERGAECPKCASHEVKKLISSFNCSSVQGGGKHSYPPPGFGGGG